MKEFEHWHPVLESSRLGKKPIQVELHGKKIVLFRDDNGNPAALEDACPHRRMPLSKGFVLNGKIHCIYHGMSFEKSGKGHNKEDNCKIDAISFDCFEKHSQIWIKSKDSFAPFPYFDIEGYVPIDTSTHQIDSPLELVLDNFTEVEHTPDVHLFLGYDPKRMNEVTVEAITNEETVRIRNLGPQKKIPAILRHFLKIRRTDLFVDDWKTFFSPVYTVYEQYWIGQNQDEREYKLRIYVFFNPINSSRTDLKAFTFFHYSQWGNMGLNLLIKPFLTKIIRLEIERDKKALETIEDKNPSVQGMKLTRFDRSLGPNRMRLKKIYRKEN